MPLRIAFDLDGVLADMDTALAREAEALFGDTFARTTEPVTSGSDSGTDDSSSVSEETSPPPTRLRLSPRQQRRLWRHVARLENFWESLDEIEEGSITRLAALSLDRRWEVIFLTRRPETIGWTSQVQTQRWLEARGFQRPSVFVVQGSRGRIAAALALDFVIDDTPENCLDVVVDSKARAVLVWRQPEQQLPAAARRLGIGVVKNVGECLNALAEADAAANGQRPGVVGRVLELLGLKGA
jgi:hypothetical protein